MISPLHCQRRGCGEPLLRTRNATRYCSVMCSNKARIGTKYNKKPGPVWPRRPTTSNARTRMRPFSRAMWDAWIADRTPDEHTLKLREGIDSMRRNLDVVERRGSDWFKHTGARYRKD